MRHWVVSVILDIGQVTDRDKITEQQQAVRVCCSAVLKIPQLTVLSKRIGYREASHSGSVLLLLLLRLCSSAVTPSSFFTRLPRVVRGARLRHPGVARCVLGGRRRQTWCWSAKLRKVLSLARLGSLSSAHKTVCLHH